MKLRYTRAMVTAALNGDLEKSEFTTDPIFGLQVPKTCPNVPEEFLDQRALWKDDAAYEAAARELAGNFRRNFEKYSNMPENIRNAGPRI
jgi:phosphoenolpyruvate carboxykinase (ATP)